MVESNLPKTAFQNQYGLFEWKVVPFGLTNALSVFMRVMNHIFSNLLDQGVITFLNDILIYIKDTFTHFQLLRKVLDRLKQYFFFFHV